MKKIDTLEKNAFWDAFYIWLAGEIIFFWMTNSVIQGVWIGICLVIWHCKRIEADSQRDHRTPKQKVENWVKEPLPFYTYQLTLDYHNWNLTDARNFSAGVVGYRETNKQNPENETFPAAWLPVEIRTKLGPDLSHIWKDPEVQAEIAKIPLTETWYGDAAKYCQEHGILPDNNLVIYDLVKLQTEMKAPYGEVNYFNCPIVKKYNSPEMIKCFNGMDERNPWGIIHGYILLPWKNTKTGIAWFYVGKEQALQTADPNDVQKGLPSEREKYFKENMKIYDDDIQRLLTEYK
jgi:hypothetical protein